MFDGLRGRYWRARRRIRSIERREMHEFRQWMENTNNLLQLTIILAVPLLIGIVTYLSNTLETVSFLLFPPLASGTYMMFANPESSHASPTRFVGGMTAGALCGWIALAVSGGVASGVAGGGVDVNAGAAALGIFLTGVVTWFLNIEQPSAFSTALLVLIVEPAEILFVLGVAISSSIVAVAFLLWRDNIYERRARYLYESTKGDDHVLVPFRGETAEKTARFAARLAAAHEAGKVVLLDVVSESAARESQAIEMTDPDHLSVLEGSKWLADNEMAQLEADAETDEEGTVTKTVLELERLAQSIESDVGVPTEVVVAGARGNPARTVRAVAQETGCDLVVSPYEEHHGSLTGFVKQLFRADIDVVVFRSGREATKWRRALVSIRRDDDLGHAMIDFAQRVTGRVGRVSVCTCIDAEKQRRRAESMLANVVETFSGSFETRVANTSIESFLEVNGPQYDLVVIGASTDRGPASRFFSAPTFERISELECDVALVHRP